MARIYYVKKARKARGACDSCGNEIEAGQGYKWVAVRPSGPRSSLEMRRHTTCPSWRPSELSFSKMRGIYAAQEAFDDESGSWEHETDVQASLEAFAEAVREVAEEYRESATNIEDGFGHATYVSDELNEKADALDGWADEVESADVPPAPERDDPATWDEEPPEDADEDELDELYDSELEAWREAARDACPTEEVPI